MSALTSAVVTGIGAVSGSSCDSTPFLKSRKVRKFMGRQDELAVVAAARALESASLAAPLGERCGLYAAVGYIPFESPTSPSSSKPRSTERRSRCSASPRTRSARSIRCSRSACSRTCPPFTFP